MKLLTSLIIAGCCCIGAVAQQSTVQHQHPQSPVIDGKLHPELIPDLVAYRLYFAAISPSPKDTEKDVNRHTAQIKMLRLHPDDEKVLTTALSNFGTQYQGLIRSYNETATAAWKKGKNVDPQVQQQFLYRRTQLVETTINGLKANLSSNGWIQLSVIVQGEKSNMKIHGGTQ